MSRKVKIYTLIAIVSMHSCNCTMDTTKLIKVTGTAILSTYTANGLMDKFSSESHNNRLNIIKQNLKDDPKADLYIKNINNTLDKVFNENIRFYWAFSPFLDKDFMKKDCLNKKEKKKNKSSKIALEKAIDSIIKPTTDEIKRIIGNTALIAGPATGVYLAFTAKAYSKNVFLVTKNIVQTIAIVGLSTGVVTNVSLHFIDKNLPKICDLGMNTYKKVEPIALKELANFCHNGMQITKGALKTETPLHLLIKEKPMKETQFFVMNTEVMEQATREYCTTMYNIAIEECFRFPIQVARYLPPVKIDTDIINRTIPTPLQEVLDRYLPPVKIDRNLYSKNN